jgi:hypothetical protein
VAPRKLDLTGHRYGALVVIAESHTHKSPGGSTVTHWHCECDCGRKVTVPGPSMRRKGNPSVAYTSAHARVKAEHGPASDWRCGCGRQADEWAYLGTDPEPKVSTHADSLDSLYSTSPEHYAPLAKPCHRGFDLWQAQRRTGLTLSALIVEMMTT